MAENNAFNRPATTLCTCWIVTRRDGLRLGFTDHDRDIWLGDLQCHSQGGFTGSDLDAKIGFAIDNSEVTAILTSNHIREDDIAAGLYDSAEITIAQVNWRDPSMRKDIWAGFFGDITLRGSQFSVELLGQTAKLAQSQGRVFSRSCDARFGDARCGVNLADYPKGTVCPRSFIACRDIFANSANYRGFPYLIGDDAMQSGPSSGTIMDGGSRHGARFAPSSGTA